MKRRIYSAGKTMRLMTARQFGTRDEADAITPEEREMCELSMLAHMLKDGETVKVYNDTAMGGLVVDYSDE